ncbi:tRNA pseudouridine(13) synthase TruD [Symmachiella dynata]|mgnify:CR=1 FL=1|uniref:tRNA pseudouridine(13) synthase TruD n=1 Tax=Symmachiella dynata TaxID=2527995 RepID=UPI0030EC5DF8
MSNLPFFTADCPGIGGRLKQQPEDFDVEEIPAYLPSGTGEHLFLWIEKRGVAAPELSRHIARTLGISNGDIGVAGMKDKQAVTRQYVSIPARAADKITDIETDDIHVLQSTLHGNKLRTGQLRGNRFSVLIRDVDAGATEQAQSIAEQIGRWGFPNYFGEQRFGRARETSQLGFELLSGEKRAGDIPYKKRKFLLKLALSAAQAELFNAALVQRMHDNLLHRVLPGDVMQVVESRGPFVVEDVAAEQPRLDAGEIALTGPMFGPKMRQPTGAARDRELQILNQFGINEAAFTQFPKLTTGTRRPYLIRPEDLRVEPDTNSLRFHFTLPAGVYATTLLREFMKTDPQP